MFTRIVAFVAIIALLSGCGDPATQAQINNYFSNKTIFTSDRSFVVYFSPRGRYYEVNRSAGTTEKGNWLARPGEICGIPDGESIECEPAYYGDGKVTVGLGGFEVANGDAFGLARRFGEGPRAAPTRSGGSDVAAAAGLLLAGAAILGSIASGTSAASAAPSSSSSRYQCQVTCKTSALGDTVRIDVPVNASSRGEATRLVSRDHSQICRSRDLLLRGTFDYFCNKQ